MSAIFNVWQLWQPFDIVVSDHDDNDYDDNNDDDNYDGNYDDIYDDANDC